MRFPYMLAAAARVSRERDEARAERDALRAERDTVVGAARYVVAERDEARREVADLEGVRDELKRRLGARWERGDSRQARDAGDDADDLWSLLLGMAARVSEQRARAAYHETVARVIRDVREEQLDRVCALLSSAYARECRTSLGEWMDATRSALERDRAIGEGVDRG